MTTSETTPPIHIKTEDGDLRICFSRAMKIAIGVATFLIGTATVGVVGFAWTSNGKLNSIENHLRDIDRRLTTMDARNDRQDDRIDRKADK